MHDYLLGQTLPLYSCTNEHTTQDILQHKTLFLRRSQVEHAGRASSSRDREPVESEPLMNDRKCLYGTHRLEVHDVVLEVLRPVVGVSLVEGVDLGEPRGGMEGVEQKRFVLPWYTTTFVTPTTDVAAGPVAFARRLIVPARRSNSSGTKRIHARLQEKQVPPRVNTVSLFF